MKKISLLLFFLILYFYSNAQLNGTKVRASDIRKDWTLKGTPANLLTIETDSFPTKTYVDTTRGIDSIWFAPDPTTGLRQLNYRINGATYILPDTAEVIIYRTPGKDSIQFEINGFYYAIKDSVGGGSSSGGNQPAPIPNDSLQHSVVTINDSTVALGDSITIPVGTGDITNVSATSPITGGGSSGSVTIGIDNAAADGSTKGAASFTAADFNSSSGNISIDYTNGQAASGAAKGFLTSADWTTFNSKVDSGYVSNDSLFLYHNGTATFVVKLKTGTVTSIATSLPITGGTITTTGTIALDTSLAPTAAVTHSQLNNTDSVGNLVAGSVGGNFTAIPVANGGTGAVTDSAARINLNANTFPDIYKRLGSDCIAQTFDARLMSASASLGDGVLGLFLVEQNITGKTITGAKWYQGTKGSTTSDNTNAIAVYSYSGGTLTQVATTGNDGTLWNTATSNTTGFKAFTGTFVGVAGTAYYIMSIANWSAVVTAPAVGLKTVGNAGMASLDFTNSAKFAGSQGAQTSMPSPTKAISDFTAQTNIIWFELY